MCIRDRNRRAFLHQSTTGLPQEIHPLSGHGLAREHLLRVTRTFWSLPRSVSYTHLDVYKRQVVDGLDLDQLVKFFEGIFGIYDLLG